MKYELTRDEERELDQELERSRKMLESMNCTQEYINHALKKVRSKLHIPPETKLLNAIFGRRANVPPEVAREFVNRVICDAEQLVREYNSKEVGK